MAAGINCEQNSQKLMNRNCLVIYIDSLISVHVLQLSFGYLKFKKSPAYWGNHEKFSHI